MLVVEGLKLALSSRATLTFALELLLLVPQNFVLLPTPLVENVTVVLECGKGGSAKVKLRVPDCRCRVKDLRRRNRRLLVFDQHLGLLADRNRSVRKEIVSRGPLHMRRVQWGLTKIVIVV